MSKAAMNLQDSFLNQVRRENSEVRVLLVNGTLLRGTVKGFDNFTLILNNRNGQHLIYKHAVAQIVTQRPHVKSEDLPLPDDLETTEYKDESTPEQTQPERRKDERKSVASSPKGTDEKRSSVSPSKGVDEKKPAERSSKGTSENQSPSDRSNHSHSHGDRNHNPKPKPKKEGFNTLDLSSVKLQESGKK